MNKTGRILIKEGDRPSSESGYSTGTIIIVFLTLTFLLGACSSYEATVERQEELRYESVMVQPSWKYQERTAQKFILPAIGAAAGAVYGSQTEFTYEGETFEGSENAAIWAGLGLLGGVVLNNVITNRQSRSHRAFNMSQDEEWLKSWNRATGSDYLIREEARNNALVLVPRARVMAIRQDYKKLEDDLTQARPSTNYGALQDWKRKLSEEYSILPPSEVRYIEELIAENEVKVASADLEVQLTTIEEMEPTYSTITTLLRLSRDLGTVYHRADAESQQRFNKQVQNKISTVLTEILPAEEQKVERVSRLMQGIEELNVLLKDFNRRYGMLRDHNLVDAVYEQFHNNKEEILIANAQQIVSQIDGATSIDQLETLETRYFMAIRSDGGEVSDLRSRLSQREEAIIAAERQKRIAAQSAAQRRAQAALAAENAALAAENAKLTPNSLSTNGLLNETLMTKMYRGEFSDINLERDDMRFAVLYSAYLKSFAQQCGSYLPDDKIEMTREVCNQWMVTRNGWGVETSRSCTGWRTISTDLFADRDMYRAKVELEVLQTSDTFRHAIGMMSADDPLASTLNLVGDVTTLQKDMNTLVRQNACDSPSLMRFQDNLRLFALSKQPKRLTGNTFDSAVVNPPPGTLFEDQNYTELLEDLVYDQSKSWVMNQYLRGSVSNVSVASRDALGRPTKIEAQYVYNGFNNQSRGSVTLTFDDGWPECLYFFDNPVACRTPNRKIVDAYANGAY
ncbi:hypothetical protein [Rhodohalobacter sp. 8-1]|uniref:hypothetical protein n=1 Tax=Rhodohalobacter sp. 8-1 TaxID=3131972 RepID=UPI0030ED5DCA